MRIALFLLIALLLAGCPRGHKPYVNFQNSIIGLKTATVQPFEFDGAGSLPRGGSIMRSRGITHVTKNKDGDLVLHRAGQEVLPNHPYVGGRNIVGRCLTYRVVDAQTHIIKRWGFDKGGNPLSCRIWR